MTLRAKFDRNLTDAVDTFATALNNIDLSGLAILDFGCGKGNLLRLLKDSKADVIYAFEVLAEEIDPDIIEWANDPQAKPRLIINPKEFKLPTIQAKDGDLTGYDYLKLLKGHPQFAIISNPPYFLWNRILSLTGENYPTGFQTRAKFFKDRFCGFLGITSVARMNNHPNWDVLDIIPGTLFSPPAKSDQCLLRTGFTGRITDRTIHASVAGDKPKQIYPWINDRDPRTDPSDMYPSLMAQL